MNAQACNAIQCNVPVVWLSGAFEIRHGANSRDAAAAGKASNCIPSNTVLFCVTILFGTSDSQQQKVLQSRGSATSELDTLIQSENFIIFLTSVSVLLQGQSPICFVLQHRQHLLTRLSDIWHTYQQRLTEYSFPKTDGAEILAAAAALAQPGSTATAGLGPSRSSGVSAAAAAAAAVHEEDWAAEVDAAAALGAAFPGVGGADATAGFKKYLHKIYMHHGVPR